MYLLVVISISSVFKFIIFNVLIERLVFLFSQRQLFNNIIIIIIIPTKLNMIQVLNCIYISLVKMKTIRIQ